MKVVAKKRMADYVEPRLSSASIERIWTGIEAEGRRAAAPSRWWLVPVAAALLGVAFLVLSPWSGEPAATLAQPEPGVAQHTEAWLATGAQARSYPLGNGSRVDLAPSTQVRLDRVGEREIRLRLERGRIDCHVSAGSEQRVVVHAGPAEMLTTDAAFHVELEMRPEAGPMLRVGVERGQVEVQNEASEERLAMLGAGQTWTNVKLSDEEPPQHPEPREVPQPKPTAAKPLVPAPAPSAEASSDPAALLAAAQRHRRQGDPTAAAADYDRLQREHPEDARAGLAAFELARLRLDQLGDARGALQAFDAALASGKGGFFLEDAEAGRVRALAKLGDSRCVQARAAFLKAHPKSPHAAEVGRLCKAP